MTIAALAAQLDGHRFDMIVGIPRGGLIVAAGLGYLLDVSTVTALTFDYDRGADGLPHIGRLRCSPPRTDRRRQRILLVEDGTATGTLLEHGRRFLDEQANADVTTTAVWVSFRHSYRPDVWVEERDELPSGASLLGLGVP